MVRDQIADIIDGSAAEPSQFRVWIKLDDGSEHELIVAATSPGDAGTTFGDLLRKERGVKTAGITEVHITRITP